MTSLTNTQLTNNTIVSMHTPITYYGGKQQLADIILNLIPRHRIYCEPFFGGGAIFFAKQPSFLEAINDKNDLLITFYHQCVNNFQQLQHRVQTTLHSESEYKQAKTIYNNPHNYAPIDIAWAVWIVTNMSVMATPRGGWKHDNGTGGSHVGIGTDNHRRHFTTAIHRRLLHVQISCHDALDVIQERDTPDTFFYLDPPYMNADQKHYAGYTTEDFQQLLELLQNISGKFLLSNFHSTILSNYAAKNNWLIQEIHRKCSIPHLKSVPRSKTEVLVRNYTLDTILFDI